MLDEACCPIGARPPLGVEGLILRQTLASHFGLAIGAATNER
jgi:hypothetical protein